MQIEHPYVIVAIFGAVALALAGGLVAVASLFGQRLPTEAKLEPYECGMRTSGDARPQFPVKFYLVGILFLLFSLEVIFLVPWAIVYRELLTQSRAFGFIEMGVFMLILLAGYVYVWKRGCFDWTEAEEGL